MLSFAGYLLVVIFFMYALSIFIGVPFLPTHKKQALKMMEFAQLKPGMTAIDLGSGAGRLLFLAAQSGATAVGYELNPFLVLWTRFAARCKKLFVVVRCKSIYAADVAGADVVFAFLFPKPMQKLRDKLFSEMKPGAKIISYVFPIPGKTPTISAEGIFVYEVGK